MLKKAFSIESARILFRIALALIFGYFCGLAILNPEYQAALWLRPDIASIITFILPLKVFMYLLGGIQVLTAFFILIGRLLNWALPLAAFLLLGIIINLGINEVSLRDFVILTGILYLYANHKSRMGLSN